MDFWASELKKADEGWLLGHTSWKQLIGELQKKSYDADTYLIEDDDRRGFILLQIEPFGNDMNKNCIEFAFTIPKYRRQGVLKAVFKKMIDSHKLQTAYLEIVPAGTYQREVWKEFGFTQHIDRYGIPDGYDIHRWILPDLPANPIVSKYSN